MLLKRRHAPAIYLQLPKVRKRVCFKKSFTKNIMSLEIDANDVKPCSTELEDHIRSLKEQERDLRNDYEKCITWRIKVEMQQPGLRLVLYWTYFALHSCEHLHKAIHAALRCCYHRVWSRCCGCKSAVSQDGRSCRVLWVTAS